MKAYIQYLAYSPVTGDRAIVILDDTQYKALTELFHNCNEAFHMLPRCWKDAFYSRLYQGK